jgi:antitoxin PrlF
MTTSITTKGQTTVPKEIRDSLKLKPGSKIKWFLDSHGGVTILPVLPITALRGILKYNGPRISIEDMDPSNFGRLRSRRKEDQHA